MTLPVFKRGIGSPNYTKAREVGQTGNKALRSAGRIHKWTAEEARAAGAKGHATRAARKAAALANEQKAA